MTFKFLCTAQASTLSSRLLQLTAKSTPHLDIKEAPQSQHVQNLTLDSFLPLQNLLLAEFFLFQKMASPSFLWFIPKALESTLTCLSLTLHIQYLSKYYQFKLQNIQTLHKKQSFWNYLAPHKLPQKYQQPLTIHQ